MSADTGALRSEVALVYTLRLVVHPIMGQMHLSGAIARETFVGEWEQVATFSETLPVPEAMSNEDDVAIMISAIAEWANRTIR
jgi:hypothetical protein